MSQINEYSDSKGKTLVLIVCVGVDSLPPLASPMICSSSLLWVQLLVVLSMFFVEPFLPVHSLGLTLLRLQ